MSEHAPRHGGGQEGSKNEDDLVSREDLKRAVEQYMELQDTASRNTYFKWKNQEVDKRTAVGKDMDGLFRVHLATARALREAGMYKDAYDTFEDIANTAYKRKNEEVLNEALAELKTLPPLH